MSPGGTDVSGEPDARRRRRRRIPTPMSPCRNAGNGSGPAAAVPAHLRPLRRSFGRLRPGASQRSNGSQNSGAARQRPEGYVVGQPAARRHRRRRPTRSSRLKGPRRRVFRPGESEPTPEPPPKPPTIKRRRQVRREEAPQTAEESCRAARRGLGMRDAVRVLSASLGRFASNATPTGLWSFPTAIRPTAR